MHYQTLVFKYMRQWEWLGFSNTFVFLLASVASVFIVLVLYVAVGWGLPPLWSLLLSALLSPFILLFTTKRYKVMGRLITLHAVYEDDDGNQDKVPLLSILLNIDEQPNLFNKNLFSYECDLAKGNIQALFDEKTNTFCLIDKEGVDLPFIKTTTNTDRMLHNFELLGTHMLKNAKFAFYNPTVLNVYQEDIPDTINDNRS